MIHNPLNDTKIHITHDAIEFLIFILSVQWELDELAVRMRPLKKAGI